VSRKEAQKTNPQKQMGQRGRRLKIIIRNKIRPTTTITIEPGQIHHPPSEL